MNYLLVIASCICYNVTGSSTVIRMPRGTYRLPVEYFPVDGNQTVEANVTFQALATSFYFRHHEWDHGRFLSRGIMVGNEERRWFPFDGPALLPFGIDGTMHSFRTSFLYSPISATEDVLVIDSSNPSAYAYQGQIYYTAIEFDDGPEWMIIPCPIRTAARVTTVDGDWSPQDLTNSDFIPTGFIFHQNADNSEDVFLPLTIRNDLIESFASLGISISAVPDLSSSITLSDIDITLSHTFPSVQIIIRTEDETYTQIALIEPTDYLISTEEPTVYRVRFCSDEASFIFDPRINRNLLIHFDYPNNRFGFGDPLVEL